MENAFFSCSNQEVTGLVLYSEREITKPEFQSMKRRRSSFFLKYNCELIVFDIFHQTILITFTKKKETLNNNDNNNY